MSSTDYNSFLYTPIAYHSFSCVEKIERITIFREWCTVSKIGERERWFWRATQMESGLGSLLELDLFCFLNLRDKKSYRWSLEYARLQSVCIWYVSIYLFRASMFPFAGHKKGSETCKELISCIGFTSVIFSLITYGVYANILCPQSPRRT